MWDDIIELILDLVLNGAAEVVDCKKAPKAVRVISAVIILAVLIGVCGFLIWIGLSDDKVVLTLLGVGLFVLFVIMGTYKVMKYRKKK